MYIKCHGLSGKFIQSDKLAERSQPEVVKKNKFNEFYHFYYFDENKTIVG